MKNTINIYKIWRNSGFMFDIKPKAQYIEDVSNYPSNNFIDYHIKKVCTMCQYINTKDASSVLTHATLDNNHNLFDTDVIWIMRYKLMDIYKFLNIDYHITDGFKSIKESRNHPIEEISYMINDIIERYVEILNKENNPDNVDKIMILENIGIFCNNVLYALYRNLTSYEYSYTKNKDIRELLTLVKFIALYTRDDTLLFWRDQMYSMLATLDITMHNIKYINENEENPDSDVYHKSSKYGVTSYLFLDTLNDLFELYSKIYEHIENIIHDNQNNQISNADPSYIRHWCDQSGIVIFNFLPDFKVNIPSVDQSHDDIVKLKKFIDSPFSYKLPKTLDEVFDYIKIKEQGEIK